MFILQIQPQSPEGKEGKEETAFLETIVSRFWHSESWEDEAWTKASAPRPHLPPMSAVCEGWPTKIRHDFARWSSKLARYFFESRSLAPSFRFGSAGCKPLRMSWTLACPTMNLRVSYLSCGFENVSRSGLLAWDFLNIKDDEDPTQSRLLVLATPCLPCLEGLNIFLSRILRCATTKDHPICFLVR